MGNNDNGYIAKGDIPKEKFEKAFGPKRRTFVRMTEEQREHCEKHGTISAGVRLAVDADRLLLVGTMADVKKRIALICKKYGESATVAEVIAKMNKERA